MTDFCQRRDRHLGRIGHEQVHVVVLAVDQNGEPIVENPRCLRRAERHLKKA